MMRVLRWVQRSMWHLAAFMVAGGMLGAIVVIAAGHPHSASWGATVGELGPLWALVVVQKFDSRRKADRRLVRPPVCTCSPSNPDGASPHCPWHHDPARMS